MPDVMHEGARMTYDDAIEVVCGEYDPDVIGVATLAADQTFDGVATGRPEVLPIRLYILEGPDIATNAAAPVALAYLDMAAAAELRDVLDAAIVQVELSRERRRTAPREVQR